jgi:hypothetical protein
MYNYQYVRRAGLMNKLGLPGQLILHRFREGWTARHSRQGNSVMSTPADPISPFHLMAHLEPPAGLSEEWIHVYQALSRPVFVVAAFYSNPGAHLQSLESMVEWLDALRRTLATSEQAMPYIHGRAPRTWNIGHAIGQAIFPVNASIGSAVLFLTHPLPVQVNGQIIGPEEQAGPSRARLDELSGFDPFFLLAELASAVTCECNIHLGLSTIARLATLPVNEVGQQAEGQEKEPVTPTGLYRLIPPNRDGGTVPGGVTEQPLPNLLDYNEEGQP